ncbi:methyltransferase domain-containing protein [Methanoregula sp.]|uniref:methyltransferase domain-containing protein n=1 Tax=Methanoregula sp. TaxID=2052170 RepID=UPI002BBD20C0|nr:methyltransferase domain-containing protein [Methanoregula sp.]HVP96000.1 methyltransferase domain-containing protein [Methanoregula sp.]
MKLLFELSGENPTLPCAELECIGNVIDSRSQVAVAECPHPGDARRLAMTHVVLEYLGECLPDITSFRHLLSDLSLSTDQPFAGRAKMVHEGCQERNPCSQREFEQLIGTMITGPVCLNNPAVEYRAILSKDRCYFGRVLFRIDRGAYDGRNPGRREFFHPGVMMPRMARTLVNLSLCGAGSVLLDPFCGTGGILIEAEMLSMEVMGSDFDPLMIQGCAGNTKKSSLLIADTTRLPVRNQTVDAVVTDFPYGQSVCIKKADTMERLYHDALDEMRRVLKPGSRAVVVTHRDISSIAVQHMTLLQHHTQRVHKSLTRHILVLGT